jgi:predicted HicB family RNase H-like nuclease
MKNGLNNEAIATAVSRYLEMPYNRIIHPTGDSGDTAFFAEVLEIEGCCAEGATAAEAYDALTKAMEIFFKLCLERGDEPPIPKTSDQYSGKLLVRMPTSLHYKLTVYAKKENVSINQLIVSMLSAKASE